MTGSLCAEWAESEAASGARSATVTFDGSVPKEVVLAVTCEPVSSRVRSSTTPMREAEAVSFGTGVEVWFGAPSTADGCEVADDEDVWFGALSTAGGPEVGAVVEVCLGAASTADGSEFSVAAVSRGVDVAVVLSVVTVGVGEVSDGPAEIEVGGAGASDRSTATASI